MKNVIKTMLATAALAVASNAYATTETTTSPTGGALPSAVTQVGGIVLDLQGASGTRVVTQLSAASLFVGFSSDGMPVSGRGNPLTIGTQTGFDASVLAALGGGLTSASVRVTLFDGDSSASDFDFNDNTFLLDGVSFGNWSDVTTYTTNDTGTVVSNTTKGFGNDVLSTGFFSSTNVTTLAALFAQLVDGSVAYQLTDIDPDDNYYDFTQGVAGGLVNVGTGPIVTPPTTPAVPEPSTWALMLAGFGAVAMMIRRRRAPKASVAVA